MRVMLCHKFHRFIGGAEVFYFEVARVLKKNGHQIAFFTTSDDKNIDTDDKIFNVSAPQYEYGNPLQRLWHLKDIFYSKIKQEVMLRSIDDFKPEVIHVFAIHVHLTPSILEAAKMRNIPVVMSCNDYKHICPNYKLFDGKKNCEACNGGVFYKAVIKKCCKRSIAYSVASSIEAYIHEYKKVYDNFIDRYLFASEFMLNKTKEFWSAKHVQYGVLKNPFDASLYRPVYQGDYALFFGRVINEKGVDRIIDAAKLSDIPIKIIGDGPELAKLQAEVEQHSLTHVEFIGPKWGKELNEILYGARFVIVPSLWHENFPYVIFQAFAAGKPVIGSLRGGIPELIGDGRGILFDPDNVVQLADTMGKLWNDIDRCQRMGKLAREFVLREFSDDIFYESLMSNYHAVL